MGTLQPLHGQAAVRSLERLRPVSWWLPPSRNEALRGVAASALVRLLRHVPTQLAMLVDKFGTKMLATGRSCP